MIDLEKDARLVATVAMAVAVVSATYIAAHSWERVRNRPKDRTMSVTGSTKKRIDSDLIVWTGSISVQDMDRTAATHALHDQMAKAHAFLTAQGIKEDQIEISAASVEEMNETETTGTGEQRVEHRIFKGYKVTQAVSVRSSDIKRVEKVSRSITDLLEQGVSISSEAPEYFYTKLGELKIQMLAEASKDARTRAENMTKSAGGAEIGKLRTADMGVININPPNSTQTSWEGNNDTSSYEKDIITIVHVTYELK